TTRSWPPAAPTASCGCRTGGWYEWNADDADAADVRGSEREETKRAEPAFFFLIVFSDPRRSAASASSAFHSSSPEGRLSRALRRPAGPVLLGPVPPQGAHRADGAGHRLRHLRPVDQR